jgi:hypothetical protein
MNIITPVSTEDGRPRSFYTYKMSFERMCRCIAKCPGVHFTERRRFSWFGDDVSSFPEIVELQDYVEQHGPTPIQRWLGHLFAGKNQR